MIITRLLFKNTFKALLCTCIFNIFFISGFAQQQLPVPDWVKGIGGMGDAKVAGIAVDQFDNVHVGGNFQGRITVTVEGNAAPITLVSVGSYDIFIFKYSPDGKLLSAKSLGGNGLDQLNNLDIDNQGNILLAIQSNSNQIDCDPGSGVSSQTLTGGWDAVVIKLHADGNFHWAKTVGSSGDDRGHVVTADHQGNIIFVGGFSGSNVGVGQGWTLHSQGFLDGFMIKYNTLGEVQWAYSIGSGGDDELKSVKADSFGNIAILGYVAGSANVNPKGIAQMLNTNSQTYFLAQYSSSGDIVWHNSISGINNQSATVAINKSNDIYVNGVFSGSLAFGSQAGGPQTFTATVRNLYLAKYESNGRLSWVRNIIGNQSNPVIYSYYITTDVNDNVYMGGYFNNTLIFGNSPNQTTLTYHGSQYGHQDTFFAKYNAAGDFIWAFNFGSACTQNYGHKIAVDSESNILLGGYFCRTVDFNPSGNCKLELTALNSSGDGYIAKYNQLKLGGDPLITDFTLNEQLSPAVINTANKTVVIAVNPGTDVRSLTPKIKIDIGVIDPMSETARDFSTPQKYVITSNCIDYEWLVTVIAQSIPCPPQSSIADAGDDQAICEQGTYTLNGNTLQADETGTWSVVSPTGYNPFNSSNRNLQNVTLNNLPPNQEIIFRWTVTHTYCPLSSFDEVKIIHYTKPELIVPKNVYLKTGESRRVDISYEGTVNSTARYLWSPATGLDDPTLLNPTILYTEDQIYTLTVFYGDCSSEYTIEVSELQELKIPNAFSPNMDGTNDFWAIKHLNNYPKVEVLVFNRFGDKVFYSVGYPTPWDGRHKGKNVPVGTYYYLIRFQVPEKTKLSGSVTIIR